MGYILIILILVFLFVILILKISRKLSNTTFNTPKEKKTKETKAGPKPKTSKTSAKEKVKDKKSKTKTNDKATSKLHGLSKTSDTEVQQVHTIMGYSTESPVWICPICETENSQSVGKCAVCFAMQGKKKFL